MTVFNDLTADIEAAFDALYSGDGEKKFLKGEFDELRKPSNVQGQSLYLSVPSDGIIISSGLAKYGKGDIEIKISLHSVIKNESATVENYEQLVDECNTLLFDVVKQLCLDTKYKRAISAPITGKDSKNLSVLKYVGTRYRFVFTLAVC